MSEIIDANDPNIPEYNPLNFHAINALRTAFNEQGINKAMRVLIHEATAFAKSQFPNAHIVKINIPDELLKIIKFLLPGWLDNLKHIYIAYTKEAIRYIMNHDEQFRKGQDLVGAMSEVFSGEETARDRVTAAGADWRFTSEATDPSFDGPHVKRQRQKVETMVAERFPEFVQEISTTALRELTFTLVGQLINPNYNPDSETIKRHVVTFTSLIDKTSKTLFYTIPASEERKRKLLSTDEVRKAQEGFSLFFDEVTQNYQPGIGGMLEDMMQDPNHNLPEHQGSIQAQTMAMFEAGSKTLAEGAIRALLELCRNLDIYQSLKSSLENNDLSSQIDFLKDVLRVSSSVDLTFRKDQYGNIIILDIASVLMNPADFPEPEKVKLNRPKSAEGDLRNFAWLKLIPDDTLRGCVGMPYSLAVLSAILSYFIRNYDYGEIVEYNGMHYDATRLEDATVRLHKHSPETFVEG